MSLEEPSAFHVPVYAKRRIDSVIDVTREKNHRSKVCSCVELSFCSGRLLVQANVQLSGDCLHLDGDQISAVDFRPVLIRELHGVAIPALGYLGIPFA